MLAMRANQPVSRSQLIDGLWGEDRRQRCEQHPRYVAGCAGSGTAPRTGPGQVLPPRAGYLLRLEPRRLDAEALSHIWPRRTAARRCDGSWRPRPGSWTRPWTCGRASRCPGSRAVGGRGTAPARRAAAGHGRAERGHDARLGRTGGGGAAHWADPGASAAGAFREQLMLADGRGGRRCAARVAAARRLLDTELGSSLARDCGPAPADPDRRRRPGPGRRPGPAARVSARQSSRRIRPPGRHPAGQAPGPVTGSATGPRELPADVAAFTGREAEMAGLDRLLAAWERRWARAAAAAVVISPWPGRPGSARRRSPCAGPRVRGVFPVGSSSEPARL